MKKIIKANKTFFLLVFSLLCTAVPLKAQVTKEFKFSIDYNAASQLKNNMKLGVKGDGSGKKIKVLVFAEVPGYGPGSNSNSDEFLYGFRSDNKSTTLSNISLGQVQIPNNPIFYYFGLDYKYDVVETNDILIFKRRLKEKAQSKKSGYFSSLKSTKIDVVVRITVESGGSLAPITGISIPGLSEFNPNTIVMGTIKVYRGNNELVHTEPIDNRIGSDYVLEIFQGDKVVFEAKNPTSTSVENLTDTNVMRWAGECIFMQNTIGNQGEIKPFLFFDSNVHGVKMRKYPKDWRTNNQHRYPTFVAVPNTTTKQLTWIANGRYELPTIYNTPNPDRDLDSILKAYKTKDDGTRFPNANKFFGGLQPGSSLLYQRNNQREGLNMELLTAFRYEEKLVPGLDPDEIIYKDFNQSKIVGNPDVKERVFTYVDNDRWKIIDDKFERDSLNNSMKKFLTGTGKFMSGNDDYTYDGFEICDRGLYINKSGSTYIEGKEFKQGDKQDMFNGKVPVYYNPLRTNKPIIRAKTLKFEIDKSVFNIKLAVLSPLEGARRGISYTPIPILYRKDPRVNFYSIINGPIHVARYAQDVEYSLYPNDLPNDVPGLFRLVYTYEDSFGILKEYAGRVTRANPTFKVDFQGGGYHDITLRYTSNPTDTDFSEEVIIAGKELMDIDLRFIFSPNDDDAKDYSFNPSTTYGNRTATDKISGNIVLNENKANGKTWFLDNNNKKLIKDGYGNEYGYKDHNVVRTYTLNRNEFMTLSVIDADPHTFVHYKNDFYLSERRLSKRATDEDLENDIKWYVSPKPDFSEDLKFVGSGRNFKVSPNVIYPGEYRGDFYLKAVYKKTNEIMVKIVQAELDGTVEEVIKSEKYDLGRVKTYPLSDDQFNLLKTIAPSFYTKAKNKYQIFKIQDILSSYTYAERKNLENNKYSPRYMAIIDPVTKKPIKEVGEHERFSEMNNYRSIFEWEFRKNAFDTELLGVFFNSFNTDDVYDRYVTNYQNKWFPLNWVRHLDSAPQSPEVPLDGSSSVREFNSFQTTPLASYNGGSVPFEPWQVRLPWIAQSGLQGYRTRWNIKAIYDVDAIFNKSQVGNAYGLTEDASDYLLRANGLDGNNIVRGAAGASFDALQREYQEFFWMLKNKEIVVVDMEELNRFTAGQNTVSIRVNDSVNNVFSNTVTKPAVPVARMAQGTNEASLTDDAKSSFCKVYPNPSSQGIFKLDINIPQENANLELQLTDIAGKIIYTSVPTTVSGNYSTTVGEKLNLVRGVYFLTIKINDYTETQKLIVE